MIYKKRLINLIILIIFTKLIEFSLFTESFVSKNQVNFKYYYLNPLNYTVEEKRNFNIDQTHIISKKFFKKTFKNNFQKFMYFDSNESHIKMKFHKRKVSTYHGNLMLLWDIFVGFDTSLSFENKKYLQIERDARKYVPGPIVSYVDKIIVIGSPHMEHNWGHTMQDFFHPFLLLPSEIRKSYKILVDFCNVGQEILLLMGYQKEQFVKLKYGEWLHSSIVCTITPSPYLSYYADLGYKVKKIFFDKFQLNLIKPFRYCLTNRKPNTWRYIQNFDEIVNNVKQTFKNYQWEVFIDEKFTSLESKAKFYATLLLLFGPTGSNIVQTYFMQNNSVIISIVSENYDSSVMVNAACMYVFFLQFPANLPHWVIGGGIVSVNDSIRNIERGLYCIKHRQWPT